MTNITPKGVIERYRHAKERRGVWESHWQEYYDYALPQRDGVIRQAVPGEKKTDKLFDGTAPDAVDQLAASLLAQPSGPSGTSVPRWCRRPRSTAAGSNTKVIPISTGMTFFFFAFRVSKGW